MQFYIEKTYSNADYGSNNIAICNKVKQQKSDRAKSGPKFQYERSLKYSNLKEKYVESLESRYDGKNENGNSKIVTLRNEKWKN